MPQNDSRIAMKYLDKGKVLDESELQAAMRDGLSCIKEMVDGEARYQDFLGWFRVELAVKEENISCLETLAASIRADADAFVTIGIGGSNQASRAAIKLLRPKQGPAMLWAGNTLSAAELSDLLKRLDKYNSIYINCIAKNFLTLEPGMTFRVLRKYLADRYGEGEIHKRIIATGTPGSTLHQLCRDHQYTFLEFPEAVGGRYSVVSNVGLFPMAVAGIRIREIVAGMKAMQERLFADTSETNPALRYACIRKLLLNHGYYIEMLSYFEPRLDFFAKWWIQTFAESEGKNNTALYPVAASNSEDLHATGQFVQQGNPIIFETFIECTEQDEALSVPDDDKKDYFDYLSGKSVWDINNIAKNATIEAHSERGIPCVIFSIPGFDERTLGEMFYFFLFTVYLSCKLLGVNPFDQPGVENYKKYMFEALGQ